MTTDAMGCQKEIVRQITDHEADNILSLKGKQGNLYKELELFLQDAKKDDYKDMVRETYTTVDGGHGRVESRTYTVTPDVDWIGVYPHPKNHGDMGQTRADNMP